LQHYYSPMSRNKTYNKQEVLEKAMNLFWKQGYEATSMQQLEKVMGINKFSIYASFKNKKELFKESIKCYAEKLHRIIDKMQYAKGGVEAIRQYFYDFIAFSKEDENAKGCLITNTANECIKEDKDSIQHLLKSYTAEIRDIFAQKLREDKSLSEQEVQEKADYLLMAMYGFSSVTKTFSQAQLHTFIEKTFKAL